MSDESARLVAESLIVIVGAVFVAGVVVASVGRAWWRDWRDDRADLVSQRRWAAGRQRLRRRLR